MSGTYTFDEARDIICGVFKDAWDVYPGTPPAIYTDIPGDTPSAPLWARVILRHATGRQSSLSGAINGCQRFTNRGTVFIQVFAEVGNGSVDAYDAAQAIATAFRKAQTGVWFRNVRINEVGADGNFVQHNVLSDFSYDDVR